MGLNVINAKMLSKMFLAGAKNLEQKKEWINELNVFQFQMVILAPICQ